ncbi:hypothetical protein AOLI_G00115300 [Acnodon oligacanthus]
MGLKANECWYHTPTVTCEANKREAIIPLTEVEVLKAAVKIQWVRRLVKASFSLTSSGHAFKRGVHTRAVGRNAVNMPGSCEATVLSLRYAAARMPH